MPGKPRKYRIYFEGKDGRCVYLDVEKNRTYSRGALRILLREISENTKWPTGDNVRSIKVEEL